jgi:hypothetical protein
MDRRRPAEVTAGSGWAWSLSPSGTPVRRRCDGPCDAGGPVARSTRCDEMTRGCVGWDWSGIAWGAMQQKRQISGSGEEDGTRMSRRQRGQTRMSAPPQQCPGDSVDRQECLPHHTNVPATAWTDKNVCPTKDQDPGEGTRMSPRHLGRTGISAPQVNAGGPRDCPECQSRQCPIRSTSPRRDIMGHYGTSGPSAWGSESDHATTVPRGSRSGSRYGWWRSRGWFSCGRRGGSWSSSWRGRGRIRRG